MKRISKSEEMNLKLGQLVVQIDANRAAILLFKVTGVGATGITIDRVKVLFQHRFKIFDSDHVDTYLLEDGDVLEIRLSKQSGIDRKGS
jgi:hypothetical protein